MKKLLFLSAATLSAASAWAGLYGDTPDSKHAWAVHDRNRPNPVKVTANPGEPPSDAIILFDGTEKTFANWTDVKGNPTKWKLVDGALESVKGAGYIATKQAFGDCQLHIEWASPKKVEGVGQGRGNSGVFLMGMYEIQVLDSYETDPSKTPNPNPNYADGQASAVYAENPPLVNATRGPGEWQTYDIVFHQPVWNGETLVRPGSITVFHNGVLTQDHWEMEGLTTHCKRRPLAPHAAKLPLKLQDHGNPVRFRNIWLREIPSRYANTTHGGPAACTADVMKLRAETAARLFAKIDTNKKDAATLNALLEVISYCKEAPHTDYLKKTCEAYLAYVAAMDDAALDKAKDELTSVRKAVGVLTRNNVVSGDCPLCKALNDIWARKGWNKRK
jgi:hypothetical protein